MIERITQGRLDASRPITIKDLKGANLFKSAKYGVKLLGKGLNRLSELQAPLNIEVSDASARVIEAIKAAGGAVTCIYRTPLLMREHLKPENFPLVLRSPLPPSRAVSALKRIEEKGAKVEYVKPRWVEKEEQEAKAQAELLKAEQEAKAQVAATPEKAVEAEDRKDKKEKKKKKKVILFNKAAAAESG